MDPLAIAAMASSVLAPYLAKGGEALPANLARAQARRLASFQIWSRTSLEAIKMQRLS